MLTEVVRNPDGREFIVEGRQSGLRRGGADAASLVVDGLARLYAKFVNNGQWQVEVRPWPTGRNPSHREAVADAAAAEARVNQLVEDVIAGR